jgi:hypothetical protein
MHGNHRQTSCCDTCPGFRLRERGVSPVPVCRRYRRISINHLRHRTRTSVRSLRRTDFFRIITHNASEPSLSDLGA